MHNTLASSVSGGDFGQLHPLKPTRSHLSFQALKKNHLGKPEYLRRTNFQVWKYKFRGRVATFSQRFDLWTFCFFGEATRWSKQPCDPLLSSDFQSYVAFFREYSLY